MLAAELEAFVRRFAAHKARAPGHQPAQADREAQDRGRQALLPPPYIRFEYDPKDKLHRFACEVEALSFGYTAAEPIICNLSVHIAAGDKVAVIGENGVGKTTLMRLLAGELTPQAGRIQWAGKAKLAISPRTTRPSSTPTPPWSSGSGAGCVSAATKAWRSRP